MIDARGLSCPQPVLLVQRAVKKDASALVEVVVDNETAVQNIRRFAKAVGYSFEVAEDAGEYKLKLMKA